jgi:hypothetical protein
MADLTLHIQLPFEARHELVRQGLEYQRTPEGQATYLLLDLLRRAAKRRARQRSPEVQAESAAA